MELTNRQKEILKRIVEEFSISGAAVSSQYIIDNWKEKKYSSATIRNEMVILEKNGLLEKLYLSAARIPTTKAFKYYDEYIINKEIDDSILDRIRQVVNKRNLSIDQIISESVQIIKEIISLPILVTKIIKNDILKKIDLIQLTENKALLIIVAGSGNISKSEITLSENNNIEDLIVCIKILNERLLETPITELVNKIDVIVKIISKEIKMNEFIIQNILLNLFKNITKEKIGLKNSKHLVYKKEIFDIEKFQKVIKILEDNSIWKQIATHKENSNDPSYSLKNIFMNEDNSGLNVSYTNVVLDNITHNISLIGPELMSYSKTKGILNFLKKEIEKKYSENEQKILKQKY